MLNFGFISKFIKSNNQESWIGSKIVTKINDLEEIVKNLKMKIFQTKR